ncbi:O-antigen ligase family protein [Gracilimonas amylolytica]|uniref:O-antigen ligase family protein n=1 Tax=Gracilimonas amylolytica TaxID=1749045 RepID=UPI000CD81D4C
MSNSIKKYIYIGMVSLWASGSVYLISIISLISIGAQVKINKYRLFTTLFFFLVVTISVIYNINNSSIKDYIQLLLLIGLLINYNPDRRLNTFVYKGFYLGGHLVIIGVIILSIHYGLNQLEYYYLSVSRTFNYSSFYLYFSFIIAPFYLRHNKYRAFIYLVLFISITLLFSTRSVLVLGLASYLVLYNKLIIKNKKFLLLIIITVVLSLSMNIWEELLTKIFNVSTNTSNLLRLGMFNLSFDVIKEFPLGVGIGGTLDLLYSNNFYFPYTHNTLADLLIELGYIGLFLYLSLVLYIIKLYRNNKNRVALVISLFIIIYSMFESYSFNIIITLITIVVIKSIKKIC